MVSHLAALTFVQWASAAFAICETDVLSNHAPFHFDLSTFDLYCALKCGARVVLLPEWASAFPGRLVKQVVERGITVWYSVPSALILMLNRGKLAETALPALRVILFAGEVFPVKYLRQVQQTVPHARLFNLYGPTETNVCTYYEVTTIPEERTEPFPIGKAIDNHDCFVLNAEGARCAPGQEGELVVRGPGLMSGYWNMPERTAKSLHLNPAPLELPDLIYRTGDLCREDADGNFVYVGRIDHMVKIRGYRVELGEVEAVLLAHPKVREAAVVPVTDGELNSQLRAHVAHDGSATAEELATFAAHKLPKYMVPELWALENSLPKTSTGKIDRQKLSQVG
jgi:acyl-coenzyme A synthetase/AMP-(fatty) acid ligase